MADKEILVVTSKVKAYVKNTGLNTSASAIEALSDKLREIIDQAVQNAKNDKRKTLKDRDVQ
jgi:histone H3/H4